MQHIKDIKMYLKMLTSSERFHMLILESAPGWGKSTTVNNLLQESGEPSVAIGSYSTPLFLYNALVMHPKKTIILDDSAGLFDSPEARAILKAATWPCVGSKDRIVSWGSTAGANKILAPWVNFRGRLVLLVNFLPDNTDVAAFKSRSFFFNIRFTKEEIAEQLMTAAKDKKYFPKSSVATKVAKHLIQNLDKRDPNQFNFRTLMQGYEAALSLGKDWSRALDQLLPEVTPESILKDLHTKYGAAEGAAEKQFREFRKITGLSRPTFQRMRADLGFTSAARLQGAERRWAKVAARRGA